MSDWDDEEPRATTCKYCGQDGLHWEDDNGKWVLLTSANEIHRCNRKSSAKRDFS